MGSSIIVVCPPIFQRMAAIAHFLAILWKRSYIESLAALDGALDGALGFDRCFLLVIGSLRLLKYPKKMLALLKSSSLGDVLSHAG